MAPETNSQPKSSARARAWLQTVANPLLGTLPIEENYLRQGLWTWRFHLQQCELLQSCRDLVGGLYVENLEDLAVRRPELAERMNAHDARLDELVQALAEAQRDLEADPAFVQAVEQARAAHAIAQPADAPWGAFKPDKLLPLAAQFVLNSVDPELARVGDSTMRNFWLSHHAELRPFGREHLERIKPVGEALLGEVAALQKALRAFRAELCDAFDLPPVPVE
jgi:hypothetical protein